MKKKYKNTIFAQPVKLEDVKEFFVSLAKAAYQGFVAKDLSEASINLIEAGAKIGMEETESRRAWQLANRAVVKAISDLIEDNINCFAVEDEESLLKNIKNLNYEQEIKIDSEFFNNPKNSPFVKDIQEFLREWLNTATLEPYKSEALVKRFPSYFVYSLRDEWAKNPNEYKILLAPMETPFSAQADMEDHWEKYRAWLEKQTEESVFGGHFSLAQLYVPLCGFYEKIEDKSASQRSKHYEIDDESDIRRSEPNEKEKKIAIVVDLKENLNKWLRKSDKEDAIRIISGGPGSGKSSFAKMFAASVSEIQDVLFIPLHLFNISKDIKEMIGEFLTSNRYFPNNPFSKPDKLLLIFDGLDEISQQGKIGMEAARDFIRQVRQLLVNHNHHELQFRVIISGRILATQAIETDFRKEGQIIYLLPYCIPKLDNLAETVRKLQPGKSDYNFADPHNLMSEDKRNTWWKNYGAIIGKDYTGLPQELQNESLIDITAEPLLNYLVAQSYERKKITFTGNTNRNELYADLIDTVYERPYQSKHKALKEIELENFKKLLEEIAVSAWQGAGRTTTVKAIEERCEKSNLSPVLHEFIKIAGESGALNLLTAFYFRQAGVQDGDKTFEFTHKSFSEYLAAKKIIRQLQTTKEALNAPPSYAWTPAIALEHWIYLCGNAPLDPDIHKFLCDEMHLHDKDEVAAWQKMLCELISYMLRNGMPFERVTPRPSYYEETRQSRNAEEALLATLSACSRYTKKISKIDWPEAISVGQWLSRLCGQRTEVFVFAYSCLNNLDLSERNLIAIDLIGANLRCSHLGKSNMSYAVLYRADLSEANLSRADLSGADLRVADLAGADLKGANLRMADLAGVDLRVADLAGADLKGADLKGANLKGANLKEADLAGTDLSRAYLKGANLRVADLRVADLAGADLTETNLKYSYAIISGAKLYDATLSKADAQWAMSNGADFREPF